MSISPYLLAAGLVAEAALVTGQLLLKRALHKTSHKTGLSSPMGRAVLFTLSIAAQAIYFFLWLGLLQKNDLSRVYPLDAIAPVLLVFAAVFILHERLTRRAWIAIGLIIIGISLISLA